MSTAVDSEQYAHQTVIVMVMKNVAILLPVE